MATDMSPTTYRHTKTEVAPQIHEKEAQAGTPSTIAPTGEPSREHPRAAREHTPADSQSCIIEEHSSLQPSNSIALGASPPLTASDGDGNRAPKAKASDDTSAGRRTSRATSSTSPSTKDLRDILGALHQIRRGRHPALDTHCDRLEFPLSISGYFQFQQLLFDPEFDPRLAGADVVHGLDLGTDLDLENLRSWAQTKLRWDYDAQQALLSIRIISVFHQAVNHELGTLLRDRFREALTASGHEGDVRYRTGVQHIFREPERHVPRCTPPRKLRQLPRRLGCSGEAGRPREAGPAESHHEGARATVGSGTAGPSGRVAQSDGEDSPDEIPEDTYTPDIGLYYVPPGNVPDYFPGLFLEVGWSHQLPDSRAKRMIRHGEGIVRYVMAFNIEHDTSRQNREMTITAHELRSTETEWFPGKCLDDYNVREHAGIGDIDVGLRLSHLHEQLLPVDGEQDIPIKLPLQRLVQIVDDAFAEQEVHDRYRRSSQSRPPQPSGLQGKRVRTATPSEDGDDEEALLRRPHASYTGPSNSKRRRKDHV